MNARKWMMEYGVAMGLAFFLAVILGQITLFRETAVGNLHASDLVQFIGFCGALVIAWMGARQLANNPPAEWKWMAPFQAIILPLATLFAVSFCYEVLLFALGPFLGKSGRTAYNWFFIAAIVASSMWIVFSWVTKCAPLIAATDARKLRRAA
jgi:hypothetical protein